VKTVIAVALIIVPLLIVAAVSYWPRAAPHISSVNILPPRVNGSGNVDDLINKIPGVLEARLKNIPGLQVSASATGTADAMILSSLTSDSGLLQLDIQAVDTRTRKQIWANSYRSTAAQYPEMLRVAAEAVSGAFR
jgi:hypothetical protein